MESILLIEDNRDILENLSEFLALEGFTVHAADNGKRGVEMALDLAPDLIICDDLMPGMNGHEVLYLIINNTRTARIPFIFSTSLAETNCRIEALELGADEYIVKPFELEPFLKMICSCLRSGSKRQGCSTII